MRKAPPFNLIAIKPDILFAGKDVLSCNSILDSAYEASMTIKTTSPSEKDTEETAKARKVLGRCKCAYILGYGFDPNNSNRIGVDSSLYYDNLEKASVFLPR